MNEIYRKALSLINLQQPVVVTSHLNPDGDAVGSALAMYWYLKGLGADVSVVLPNSFPEFLNWLEGSSEIIIYKDSRRKAGKIIKEAATIFCLDYNAIHRLGDDMAEIVREAHGKKILIDHHIDPENDFDLVISTTSISSTSEMIFGLIEANNHREHVTRPMAEALYTGIVTDTGSFSYACNYPDTFRITGFLIAKGVDGERVHRLIYDNYSEHRMRLLGHCLSERLTVLHKLNTAYIYLTAGDLKKFNFRNGDTEGVVNYALAIKGINLAALFTEKKEHIRISLRSKGTFSVNDLVRKHFEGGGHRNAAGGNSYLSLDETLKKFESLLPQYSEELCCVYEE